MGGGGGGGEDKSADMAGGGQGELDPLKVVLVNGDVL